MNKNISLNSQIQISKDAVSRNLQGEMVILNLKTNVYCGLDQIGARIWQLINEHKSLKKVLDKLVEEYEVTEEEGTKDLLNFISMLQEKELIEA